MLSVALPKGRLGEKAVELLARAGFGDETLMAGGRKLITQNADIRYFWVKPSDVGVYVERGAADIGIVGRDILLETGADLYELLDLDIGKCRICVIAKPDFKDSRRRELRVATKFPNIAKTYYLQTNRAIDIIKLNGSIELAPLLGLSDVIVDIVETGETIKANGLEITDTVAYSSAWLVANKVSYKFKNETIVRLTEALGNSL